MNPAKIYVEVPGVLGWRTYDLDELARLWRAAQLPREARYQADRGEWRPLAELVGPVIEREMAARGETPAAQLARQSRVRRHRWVWAGVGLGVLVVLGVWQRGWERSPAREQEEVVEWERGVRKEHLIKSGQVVPGMTLEEVRRGRGEPRTKKVTADGTRQQWIYRQETVVFENGIVMRVDAAP